jgi:DNA polymerase-3 subunit gamma/tau
MSYQVLARKWRPGSFADMVGQTHVLRALINALDHDRLHHAYLFTGTRGVGKTTIARIFAKSLNCEQGISSTPCGVCSTCMEVNDGRFIDLIEVDAASRTKVEDTRELLDNVQYAPTRGRYKVYLIDEVHMLSAHSFNALLKTLEEPPPHVKFLLATTDPQKLPATVLSRCLQFNLKRLPVEQIRDYLMHLLGEEKLSFDENAILKLAQSADGSMRDALSLLDQAIAFTGGELREADVCNMLGAIDQRYVFELLEAIAANSGQGMLDVISRMDEQVPDYSAVLVDLLSTLQKTAVLQAVPGSIDKTAPGAESIQQLADLLSPEDVQLCYQIGLHGRRDLELSADLRSGFEMVMLRMLAFRPVEGQARAVPSAATRAVTPSVSPATSSSEAAIAPVTPKSAQDVREDAVVTVTPVIQQDENRWDTIVAGLGLSGLEQQLAVNCALQSREGNRFNLALSSEHSRLHNKKFEERLLEALTRCFGENTKLTIEVGEHASETPAMRDSRERSERQSEAEQSICNDDNVQSLQEIFGATILTDSVQPVD